MYQTIHSTLHTSLSKQQHELVSDRLQMLRGIVERRPDYLDIIGKDVQWEGEYIPHPVYYLRIADENGRALVETPGMKKAIPTPWDRLLHSKASTGHHEVIWQSPNGRYFWLEAESVAPPHGPVKKLTMEIALDVTSAVTIDNENHKRSRELSVLIALIFSSVMALLIKRTLKPLNEIAGFSGGVTIAKLSERTNPEDWPVEVKEVGRSLNQMLDRLEDSLTRLSQFASNIAHEIRTPINNLMGEAEIALMRDRTPQEYKKVLESGMEECDRLFRLVDNLLFLAHAENPAIVFDRALFDPIPELEDLFSVFRSKAEAKGAELMCRGDAFIFGDKILFRRTISNLLANALNYSANGVNVDVAVRETGGRWTEVAVCDTGFGVAEQDLPRIFDRFYRADNSRSLYAEGSGLGLSIVKTIIDLHGGTVSVESKLGAGTTFFLRFPREPLGDEDQASNFDI